MSEQTFTPGTQHIAQAFSQRQNKAAFMPYVALGYPTPEASLDTIRALVEAGADLIELGVPFSDPLADGPTIQAATQKALENGITLKQCLAMAQQLRAEGITTPFVMMGYMNPFMAFGLPELVAAAREAGIDGFIVPDLPPEESAELDALCRENEQALIYFLAPTSTAERIQLVAEKASGFIYLVSLTGVTGARHEISASLPAFLAQVRAQTDKPLAVGFGISDGAQAQQIAQYADGVIIGSAIIKKATESTAQVKAFGEEIVSALRAG